MARQISHRAYKSVSEGPGKFVGSKQFDGSGIIYGVGPPRSAERAYRLVAAGDLAVCFEQGSDGKSRSLRVCASASAVVTTRHDPMT
jgi:hypothetical protein